MRPIVMGPSGIHFNQFQNPMSFAPRTAEINNRAGGESGAASSLIHDPINYEIFNRFDKNTNPINTP